MSDDPYAAYDDEEIDESGDASPFRMPIQGHLLCGWPLLLVVIGGAIGGGLGGMAYAINGTVYKSDLSIPVKIILNIVIGGTAIVLWLGIGMAIEHWRS